jgi:hypothetical protein
MIEPIMPPSSQQQFQRSDSQETPPTPLFDEDVSQPLEPFPRVHYTGDGWEMHLRQPNKKKITGQRSHVQTIIFKISLIKRYMLKIFLQF